MKRFMWFSVLLSAYLCVLDAQVEIDVTQLKTFSSIGKERPDLNGFKEAELLRHDGKGCLTHAWFGGDWPGYDKTILRVYADGEERPFIEMELSLGHGVGFGDNAAPFWWIARGTENLPVT